MKKQYNSSADRRWQQRYQRVQERKDANWDYYQDKRDRKKMRTKKPFVFDCGFDVERIGVDKTAVVCRSFREVQEVVHKINKLHPEWCLIGDPIDLWTTYGPCVTFGTYSTDYYFFEGRFVRVETENSHKFDGFRFLEFYECCPVKDLGAIEQSDSVCDFFEL